MRTEYYAKSQVAPLQNEFGNISFMLGLALENVYEQNILYHHIITPLSLPPS